MTDRGRRGLRRKMHPGDQGIGGGDEFGALRHLQHRRVITDAQAHIGALRAAGAEVALDEGSLRQRHDASGGASVRPAAARVPPDRALR